MNIIIIIFKYSVETFFKIWFVSCIASGFFTTELPGKPTTMIWLSIFSFLDALRTSWWQMGTPSSHSK